MAKKKKKKKGAGRLYLFLALVLLIAVGALVLSKGGDDKTTSNTNYPSAGETVNPSEEELYSDVEEDDATYKEVKQEDLIQVADLSVYQGLDETWHNILLLGVDTRDFKTWGRSDTMIIASINTKTGAVRMCSILRDTWVNIPGVGEERINVAYQYGGPQLAMKTVNENFNMNITDYVVVNFSSFPHLIDAIGGVDINVKNVEVPQINHGVKSSIFHGGKLGLDESDLSNELLPDDAEGMLTLTGRQALGYARIRKIDSDFMRTSRQRTVISAAMIKFRDTTDTMVLLNLASSLVGYVETNIDVMTMVGLAVPVLKAGIKNISEMRIPMDNTYTYESRNFIEAFYDLDLEATCQGLHDFIYGE